MADFVYEYIFFNSFDESIFNQGPVSDPDFMDLVKLNADMITVVLENNPGIPVFSTSVEYDVTGDKYKITVKRQ